MLSSGLMTERKKSVRKTDFVAARDEQICEDRVVEDVSVEAA